MSLEGEEVFEGVSLDTVSSALWVTACMTADSDSPGVEIKPNIPLAWGMSSPEKLLVPKKNH